MATHQTQQPTVLSTDLIMLLPGFEKVLVHQPDDMKSVQNRKMDFVFSYRRQDRSKSDLVISYQGLSFSYSNRAAYIFVSPTTCEMQKWWLV